MALVRNYGIGRTRTPYGGTSSSAIPQASMEAQLNSPIARREMDMARGSEGPVSEQRATALVRSGYTKGQSIADYQKFLASRGLYKGRIDGIWGPQMEAAQKAYLQWNANNKWKMQDSLEAGAASEAAAARAKILQLSKEAAAVFGARAAAEFAKYADANRYGNQAAIVAMRQVESQLRAGKAKRAEFERKKNDGWLNKAKRVIGTGVKMALPGLNALGYLQEELGNQPYYAAKRAQLTGGSFMDQLGAGIAGLPGLGGVAASGSRQRQAIEDTNSRREREYLTKTGELASVGELLSGRAYGRLKGEAAKQYGKTGANHLPGVASPVIDAGFQIATDPLSYIAPLSRSLGLTKPIARAAESALRKAGLSLGDEAGQLVAQAAKIKYIRESATGKAAVDKLLTASNKAVDAKQFQRMVKGLTYGEAERIFKAPQSVRREFIEDALAGARIPMELAARKQAAIKLTGGRLGSNEFIRDGLRAKGGDFLRRVARGDEVGGQMLPTKKTGLGLDNAIESGLLRTKTGERLDDFIKRVVRPAAEGVDIPTRIGKVWDAAEKSGNGAFMDSVERQVKGLLAEARKAGVSADDLLNGEAFDLALTGVARAGATGSLTERRAAARLAAQMLERLEAAAAIFAGEAGEVAAEQAGKDLALGLVQKRGASDVFGQVKRAGESVGLTLPRASKLKFSGEEARLLRAEINTAIRDVDDALADKLIKELDKASAGNKSLGRLRTTVDALKRNPDLMDEAGRIALNEYRMAQQGVIEDVVPGLGRRVAAKAASLPLAFSEARYADSITFEGRTANEIMNASDRVEQIDRWAMGLGLDDFARGRVREAFANVKSEQEMYDLIKSISMREAKKMGLDPKDAEAALKEARKALRQEQITMVLRPGETTDEVYTLAQLGERVPLLDPTDLRKALTLIKAERGNALSKARAQVDKFGNRPLGTIQANGQPLTVRAILKKGHSRWKFLVVTNFYAGGVGAAGGFIGSEDKSILGRFKSAAMWGAIAQGTAPVRYILRVVGIEEGLRKWLDQGLNSEAWIPTLARRAQKRGFGDDYSFLSKDLVRSTSSDIDYLRRSNRHLLTPERGWRELGRNESRYPDAWSRIVNRQVHPETDVLAQILLKEKAGYFTRVHADEEIRKFLASPDGQVVVKRLRSGTGNKSKKPEELLEQYRTFIDSHFDEELADARLAGQVEVSTLKEAAKAGRGPESLHAQKFFIFPKNAREAITLGDRLAAKFVLEGPTTVANRGPVAETIFNKRFKELVDNGVPMDDARLIADEFAVMRTNELLFNINDESRFAAKADVFLPFQQPREEMVRVWGKLITRNPGRTMVIAANAAKAFNAGVDNGMFYKDPFTGDWKLRAPGNAQVSRLVGNFLPIETTLKDYVFFGQGAFGVGFLPSPGGPYWTMGARAFIDTEMGAQLVKDMPEDLRQLIFPYGADGQLMPRAANRLWMALTYSTPPWEVFGKFDQQNVLDRTEASVAAELAAEFVKKHGRLPSVEEYDAFYKDKVIPATKALLKSWALMTSLNPAAVRPLFPKQQEYYEVRKIYTDNFTGETNLQEMFADHPWTKAFLGSNGKEFVGPDDYDTWQERLNMDPELQRLLRYNKYRTGREYLKEMAEGQETSLRMSEMFEITKNPNLLEKEEQLAAWRERNPELAAGLRSKYASMKELGQILHGYPRGPEQDRALDAWRRHYDISPGKFRYMRADIEQGRFRTNPWQDGRDMEDVYADVRKQMRRGFNEDAYVATLQPVEQIRYWNQRMLNLNTDALGKGKTASVIMDEWKLLKEKQGQVWQAHPFLGGLPKPKSAMEKAIGKWQGDYRQGVSDLWTQINTLTAAKKQAAEAKSWGTYYKLKAQIDSLHDARIALMNKMYHEVPDFPGMQDELRANMVFGGPRGRGGEDDFLLSNEEKTFSKMPDGIRGAYITDLVDRLDQENFSKGKLFWEWLTDFQRDLIEKNLPKEDVDNFKNTAPGSGGKGGGGGRGGYGRGGGGFSAERNEIGFAIQAFKDWTKRPAGAKAPAAYAEYMKLPNDSVVRSEFLKRHPEVRDWVKAGPMANMPPVLRYIVANIMVKYGRWEGEQREYAEITDLAFAQEQMNRFNLRKDKTKPAAYDIWANMPSGAEKAIFLQQHPEVGDWIRLGPMANMPEEYQDVVRDIMIRYGEWTERDDPLGNTIRGFYKLPQHARDQYLKDHPELTAYWAETRSPQEKAQHALADRYFALNDQGAKRFFMLTHPELQQWFIEQRTKRYERFLNRVAVYMGSNPEMFEHYLKRQEDVLSELLNRFAESPLIREMRPQSAAKATSGESGRKRSVAAA